MGDECGEIPIYEWKDANGAARRRRRNPSLSLYGQCRLLTLIQGSRAEIPIFPRRFHLFHSCIFIGALTLFRASDSEDGFVIDF